MSRKLHDQPLVITCKGAKDFGAGVRQYIIFALRADLKGDPAPADTQANFGRAVEIGRIDALDSRISYRGGTNGAIRDYDPLNEYRYHWYGWEDGYAYTIWTFAVDASGNLESRGDNEWGNEPSGVGNYFATPVLYDSRPPQFMAKTGTTRVPHSATRISTNQPWLFDRNAAVVEVQPDTGPEGTSTGLPGWTTTLGVDALAGLLFVFQTGTRWYFAEILGNEATGANGADQLTLGCSPTNPILALEKATGELTAVTAMTALDTVWATGEGVLVNPVVVTGQIGRMELQYQPVDPKAPDLDHYRIECYVANTAAPVHASNEFGFFPVLTTEANTATNYNLRWKRTLLSTWDGAAAFTDDVIYGRGLYVVIPVDTSEAHNEGFPTIAWAITNPSGFYPATGTPPAAVSTTDVDSSANDGSVVLEWDKVNADDLRGYILQRQRGVYTSGDKADPANYTWGAWETTDGDIDDFAAGTTLDYKYTEAGLEPFSTDTRAEQVAYRYQIRAVTWNGLTSETWTVFTEGGSPVIRVIDVTPPAITAVVTTLTPKIGAIQINLSNLPEDTETVYLQRSPDDDTSWETAGGEDSYFKRVDVPYNRNEIITQDEYPDLQAPKRIYYRARLADHWGNLSARTPAQSAVSKTQATAADARPPYPPEILTTTYREADPTDPNDPVDRTHVEVTFTKSDDQELPGVVAITQGSRTVTGTGTTFDVHFAAGEEILFEHPTAGDIPMRVESVEGPEALTLAQQVTVVDASGMNYRGSQDYRGALLFKQKWNGSDWDPADYVGDTNSSTVSIFRDYNVIAGTWRYLVSAYDVTNNESALSAAGPQVVVSDTVAPDAPGDIQCTGGVGRLHFSWSRPPAPDIRDYQVGLRDHNQNPVAAGTYTADANELVLDSITIPRENLALNTPGEDESTTQTFWQIRVTVYDWDGNATNTGWKTLDEEAGAGNVPAHLKEYRQASGAAPSTPAELAAAFTTGSGEITSDEDGGAQILAYTGGFSDLREIELLVLYAEIDIDGDGSFGDTQLLTEFSQRANQFGPGQYASTTLGWHAKNLLREADDPAADVRFYLRAVSWDGMATQGNPSAAIQVTDVQGPDITTSPLGPPNQLETELNVGSIMLWWIDVLNKFDAKYEIWRSPDGDFSQWDPTQGQPTCEKIQAVPASRVLGTFETLHYADNDWDPITGLIPDPQTILGTGAYANGTAVYRVVGVDRWGNRPQVSDATTTLTTGTLRPMYYAPTLPVGPTCLALFPFNAGSPAVSTNGITPAYTGAGVSANIQIIDDGLWGDSALRLGGQYLDYDLSGLPGDDLTLDFFLRHPDWDADGTGAPHALLDLNWGGNPALKRIALLYDPSGPALGVLYVGDNGGASATQLFLPVDVNSFNADTWYRMTVAVEAGELRIFFNLQAEDAVTTPLNDAITGTDAILRVNETWDTANPGTGSSGVAGDYDIDQLSIWTEGKNLGTVLAWHRMQTQFLDLAPSAIVPPVILADGNLEFDVHPELIRTIQQLESS